MANALPINEPGYKQNNDLKQRMIIDIQKRKHLIIQNLLLPPKILNLVDEDISEDLKIDIASIFRDKNKDLVVFFIFGETFQYEKVILWRNFCNLLYLVSTERDEKDEENFRKDFLDQLKNNGIGLFKQEELVIRPESLELPNEIKEVIMNHITTNNSFSRNDNLDSPTTKQNKKSINSKAKDDHLFGGIVIDGSNIALDGKTERNGKADIERLEILFNQLIEEYGFSENCIEIFVRPDLKYQAKDYIKNTRPPSKDFQRLIDLRIIEETPLQNKKLQHTDEDDFFILNVGIQSNYYILSNDFFRNWRKKDQNLDFEIEKRRVTYKWIKKAKKFTFESKLKREK